MESLSVNLSDIVFLLGFVVLIWQVKKILNEVKSPQEELEELVTTHDKYLKGNYKRLLELEKTDEIILKSLLSLVDHQISGNGTQTFKKVRDEIRDYLITKSKKEE